MKNLFLLVTFFLASLAFFSCNTPSTEETDKPKDCSCCPNCRYRSDR